MSSSKCHGEYFDFGGGGGIKRFIIAGLYVRDPESLHRPPLSLRSGTASLWPTLSLKPSQLIDVVDETLVMSKVLGTEF